ncbi:hypothetical protein Tco_0313786 [Tanacetum coccineum]
MQRGCGKSAPNPSIPSLKTKRISNDIPQGSKESQPYCGSQVVRFTKLITDHLQRKHKFHPRQVLHLILPNKDSVLGYLKFSAKGSKREVFGIPIPNNLITADIQGEQYYNAYLEKVANHQRYLAGEEVTAKAPKPQCFSPPKPTPATTEPSKKDQSKKRKLVKESSEAPSPAKQPKAGKVIKKRTQKSSLQLVDEFVDEGVPVNEPRFGDEEADMQKAWKKVLTDVQRLHIKGKGKEKVGEEQAAQVLLNLQTPKKKSPADQFIF